jgi:excinuclease ABC subunit C
VNKRLEKKLKDLPKSPGVYFHKNSKGTIIYVGKAANLRNRVSQYFQKSRARDPKTELLVEEIADTDWAVVDSEIEALFLEAELIRRYMPQYNILLRDDKSMVYVRIDIDSDFPTVTTTRRPLDDKAKYVGPFLSAYSLRQALKLLRRIFPYATSRQPGQKRATLYYHLGLDPGLEEGLTDLKDYRANLRKLIAVLEGKRKNIEREIEREMKLRSQAKDFEAAAKLRNQYLALRNLNQKVLFSDKEFQDISKDHALNELVNLLGLNTAPKRIEGYDISHMSGVNVVASMVVFSNGVSNKREYRKFKTTREFNNDFAKREEQIVIRRETGDISQQTKNSKLKSQDSGLKTQVSNRGSNVELNEKVLHELGGFTEVTEDFILVNLPMRSNLVKLLQRIRDESHRFAVSYHTTLKRRQQTTSMLDEVPGIGPVTRKKLVKTFGSVRGIQQARQWELEKLLGEKKATVLRQYLRIQRKSV